jgi:hypothetical protein
MIFFMFVNLLQTDSGSLVAGLLDAGGAHRRAYLSGLFCNRYANQQRVPGGWIGMGLPPNLADLPARRRLLWRIG